MRKQINPLRLTQELVKLEYSPESASIITAQYLISPNDRSKWGTEEQTRLDIESIIDKLKRV